MPKHAALAGFVLAGGRSSRMGRDKALLEWQGIPLALRAAETLRPFVSEVKLLGPSSRFAHLGIPVIEDEPAVAGPLAGLCAALEHSRFDWNLFLACDLPLVTPQLIEIIVRKANLCTAQAVVPQTGEARQPLCAAYHRNCLPIIRAAIAWGERSINRILGDVRTESLGPDGAMEARQWDRMFANINTPEDWAGLHKLASPHNV
jgi:molybdenum cofactor guanylyltransferase